MTKRELIKAVKEKLERNGKHYQKWELEEVVSPLFDSILETLQRSEEVAIKNFGTFGLKYYKAHERIHPVTSQRMKVPAKVAVTFKATRMFTPSDGVIEKIEKQTTAE